MGNYDGAPPKAFESSSAYKMPNNYIYNYEPSQNTPGTQEIKIEKNEEVLKNEPEIKKTQNKEGEIISDSKSDNLQSPLKKKHVISKENELTEQNAKKNDSKNNLPNSEVKEEKI